MSTRNAYKLLAEKYQTIAESLADSFDEMLKNAGFPKEEYDTADVFKLIEDFVKTSPEPLERDDYRQMAKALEWNNIDTGLIDDYLQYKSGFDGIDERDPQAGDIDEAPDTQAIDVVRKHINDATGIEVQTAMGNKVMPISEVWFQDGIIKISI